MTQRLETEIAARNKASHVFNKVTGDTKRMRKEMNLAGLASKQFSENLGGSKWKRQVQQAGMQLSDFSVQVAGGQSAILAFTQNAPQFIQNFGAMGGVIAAAVTILGTFAYAASRTGEAVLSFSEQIDITTGSLDDYFSMIRDNENLGSAAFKAAEDALKTTSDTASKLFMIARIEAQGELRKLGMSLRQEIIDPGIISGSLRGELALISELLDGTIREQIGALGGATGNRLNEFAIQLERLGEALTVDEQYDAAQRLLSALTASAGSYAEMDKQQKSVYRNLVQMVQQLELMGAAEAANLDTTAKTKAIADAWVSYGDAMGTVNARWSETHALIEQGRAASSLMAKVISDEVLADTVDVFEAATGLRKELGDAAFEALRLSGVDIESGVDAAAKAAAKLAGGLGISLELATKIQALSGKSAAENAFDAKVRAGILPPQAAGDFNAKGGPRPFDLQQYMSDVEKRLAGISAGASAADGGGGSAPQLNPNDAIVRMLGYNPKEIMKDQVDYIADSFTSMQQTVSQSMMSGFKGLLAGTKSLGEAVRDILSSILDSIIDILMTPVFNSIAGSLAGGILGAGGPITALGGSIVDSFEGGGSTGSRPRTGGIDGRGGFPAILHGNETVIDHTKGQGTAPVTINFNVQATDVDSFRRSQRQIERDLVGAVRRGGM